MNETSGKDLNKIDLDITRVLTGLRDAAPSPHMERRILAALETRSSQRAAPSSRWIWYAAPIALTALTIAVFFTISHRKTHSVEAPPFMQTASVPLSTPTLTPQSTTPIKRTPRRSPVAQPVQIPAPDFSPGSTDLARFETDAPSLPPPSMELTAQERIMQRIANAGNSIQLAELNPALREAQQANDIDQFQQFFPPPRRQPPHAENQ